MHKWLPTFHFSQLLLYMAKQASTICSKFVSHLEMIYFYHSTWKVQESVRPQTWSVLSELHIWNSKCWIKSYQCWRFCPPLDSPKYKHHNLHIIISLPSTFISWGCSNGILTKSNLSTELSITFSTSLQQAKAIDKELHHFYYFSCVFASPAAPDLCWYSYQLLIEHTQEDTAGFACSRIFPI